MSKVGQDPAAAGGYPAGQQPGVYMQPGVYQQPVVGQPGMMGMAGIPGGNAAPVVWMPKPAQASGCPPGLEYLTQIDQILVKQQIDIMELITNWEQENKYRLLNTAGQQIYFAKEESDTCQRQCCRAARSFTMHITDNAGMEVIRLQREFKCSSPCFACLDCCAHIVAIEAPVGQTIGYVKQKCGLVPKYSILDAEHVEIMVIEGPCCMCPCTDVDFNITSAKDGVSDCGKITKQWGHAMQELFTSADNFGIQFPMDLDVKVKAVMIGAVFLIDFMYFEQPANQGHHHRRY